MAEQTALVLDGGVAGEVVLEPVPPVPPRVAPLSEEKFALQLTISASTREKLLRAQAHLRHQVPSGDLAEVLDVVLDRFLDKVEARKFGKVKKPRAARKSRGKRYVPNETRRQAVARDGMRCSFVSQDGRRCEETGFLELDHVMPVARGGEASDGVRVLCRSHNQYEAERILGRETVDAGRSAKAMDDDLIAGLRRMGVTASDARQAVAASRGPGSAEERMPGALRALRAIYVNRETGTRCREMVRAFGHASRRSA